MREQGNKGSHAADSAEWRAWEPERLLQAFSSHQIRFHRGFTAVDPQKWFPALNAHWIPLFHTVGADFVVRGIQKDFSFPRDLPILFAIELDNEPAVLGLKRSCAQALTNAVAPGAQGAAAEVVLDYLERRFLSSLSRSWGGEGPLSCQHVGNSPNLSSVAAVVQLSLTLSGDSCDVWLGVGPKALERLNSFDVSDSKRDNVDSGGKVSVSLDLAELLVPPELLIDYLRTGTVIGLELPVRPQVIIRANETAYGIGKLGRFDDRFAVEFIEVTDSKEKGSIYRKED
jgi:hypothetical protein